MGMFDGQGIGGPMPRNLAEMGRGVGQSLGRGLLDPIMKSQGFISEEDRIMDIMKDVDISNVDSVSETFRKIMEINPEAAGEFRAQVMPLVTAKQNEILSMAKKTAANKPSNVQTKTVGYSFNGVKDPTKTMELQLINNKWTPILDTEGNPFVQDKYQRQSMQGNISQDYQIVEDESGNTIMQPIAGSPAEADIKMQQEQKVMSQANLTQKAETVLSVADTIRATIDASKEGINVSSVFGVSGLAQAYLPGSRSADIDASITTLNARIGFDELAAMRKESPTGGALGQVSELELKQLNAALGSLSRFQSEAQFLDNLTRIEEQYTSILQTIAETGDGTYMPKLNKNGAGI